MAYLLLHMNAGTSPKELTSEHTQNEKIRKIPKQVDTISSRQQLSNITKSDH